MANCKIDAPIVTAAASPFPHWIIDDFLPAARVEELAAAVPPPSWDGWEARYDNDCERGKRTCRRLDTLPPAIASELQRLTSLAPWLESLTGVHGLQADETLHGAGLHVTEAGGYLVQHLDYALHPNRPSMERRVNLIVSINRGWRDDWGGAFELGDDMGNAVKRVYPKPGRAVVWLPGDTAYHGTERVKDGESERRTLAVYFLAPARPEATRKRALFVPHRRPLV